MNFLLLNMLNTKILREKKIYKYQVKSGKKNKISENFSIISTFEHNFSHFQLKVLMVEILLNKKGD